MSARKRRRITVCDLGIYMKKFILGSVFLTNVLLSDLAIAFELKDKFEDMNATCISETIKIRKLAPTTKIIDKAPHTRNTGEEWAARKDAMRIENDNSSVDPSITKTNIATDEFTLSKYLTFEQLLRLKKCE